MKKLFKQYKEISHSISESKNMIANMSQWSNIDEYDRLEIKMEGIRLTKSLYKMKLLLIKIEKAAAKELEKLEHEHPANLQSA